MCPLPLAITTVSADAAHRHILVVDDDGLVAMTIQAGLEKLPSCQVEVATSGEQALSLLKDQPFHLVITDYRMPGMSGVVLAERIKKDWPHMPILMITAYASDLPRSAVLGGTIERVLNKPVAFMEMRCVAEEFLPQVP